MPTAAAITSATAAVGGALLGRSASKKAAKSQRQGQDAALAATKEAADLARSQAIPLFNAAQQNQQQGFQGALDIFGQTAPAQMNAFQGGNLNAQNTLRAGLDPQIAAILGGNIDLSGLQAQQSQAPPASMFQQQLPDFQTINQSLGVTENNPLGSALAGVQADGSDLGFNPQGIQDFFAQKQAAMAALPPSTVPQQPNFGAGGLSFDFGQHLKEMEGFGLGMPTDTNNQTGISNPQKRFNLGGGF